MKEKIERWTGHTIFKLQLQFFKKQLCEIIGQDNYIAGHIAINMFQTDRIKTNGDKSFKHSYTNNVIILSYELYIL